MGLGAIVSMVLIYVLMYFFGITKRLINWCVIEVLMDVGIAYIKVSHLGQ